MTETKPKEISPLDRAEKFWKDELDGVVAAGYRMQIIEALRVAFIGASQLELDKRREVEAQLAQLKAILAMPEGAVMMAGSGAYPQTVRQVMAERKKEG